jgi:hypothetical protein
MLERLKRTLVETYIGAIALGYLLAQAVLQFANTFASPLQLWATQNELAGIAPGNSRPNGILLYTLGHFADFLALLLVWYLLFRWLYFKPFQKEEPEPAANPEQAV